jgi:tRNA(Arg) A34 adenosine deaminase TadA
MWIMIMDDVALMREAIALSSAAVAKGNEPFGALLARDGEIVLRAENTIYTAHDVTNHAETNLVQLAVAQYDTEFLRGCTLYTSTEPCAMCAGAIFWSGVGRVVFGCSEKRLGEIVGGGGLDVPCREIFARGSHPVEVSGPLLEDEAAAVHLGYWGK